MRSQSQEKCANTWKQNLNLINSCSFPWENDHIHPGPEVGHNYLILVAVVGLKVRAESENFCIFWSKMTTTDVHLGLTLFSLLGVGLTRSWKVASRDIKKPQAIGLYTLRWSDKHSCVGLFSGGGVPEFIGSCRLMICIKYQRLPISEYISLLNMPSICGFWYCHDICTQVCFSLHEFQQACET